MKFINVIALLFCASAVWAQSPADYMQRGQGQLESLLRDYGTWETTIRPDQVVARCTSCEQETVVRISIQDLSETQPSVAQRLAYVRSQRLAYCHKLTATSEGRCIDWTSAHATSLEFSPKGDIFVSKTNLIYGPYLLTGKYSGPPDFIGLRRIQSGLPIVVRSFTALW